jgi:hypothetical protein
MIQVMNGLKAEIMTLKDCKTSAVEGGIGAGQNVVGNSMLVQSCLDDLQRRVAANERYIASLKQNAENYSQFVIVMEGKMGTLDYWESIIKMRLSKARKKQQNEMVKVCMK